MNSGKAFIALWLLFAWGGTALLFFQVVNLRQLLIAGVLLLIVQVVYNLAIRRDE